MSLADDYLAAREEQERLKQRPARSRRLRTGALAALQDYRPSFEGTNELAPELARPMRERRQQRERVGSDVLTKILPGGEAMRPIVEVAGTRGGRESAGRFGRRVGEGIADIVRSAPGATRAAQRFVGELPETIAREAPRAVASAPRIARQTAQQAPGALRRIGEAASGAGRYLASRDPLQRGDVQRGLVAIAVQDILPEITYRPYVRNREARNQMDVAELAGDQEGFRRASDAANTEAAFHAMNLGFGAGDLAALGASGRRAAPAAMRRAGSVNMADEVANLRGVEQSSRTPGRPTFGQIRRTYREGLDRGEAPSFIRSQIKGLDMSPEARMGRAREQGFDVDTPLYHGTNKTFSAFSPSEGGSLGPGVYLTDSPTFASRFARTGSRNTRGNVLPVFSRGREGKDFRADSLYSYVDEGANERAVFSPNNIRSTQAAFDPARRNRSDILARRGVSADDGDFARQQFYDINRLPSQPQRPFEADYPRGAQADEAGRLTRDIEGRPLIADTIVGRRMVHAGDEALPEAQTRRLAANLTGRDVTPLTGGTDAGRTYRSRRGEYEIAVREGMKPRAVDETIRHEIGHVIDELAGRASVRGIERDLRRVYDAGVSGKFRNLNLTTPQRVGYSVDEAPRELIAEAVRQYLGDPNALKSLAPRVAARIREAVNANPKLSRAIQFNALPPIVAGAIGAGTIGLGAGEAQAQEGASPELVAARKQVSDLEAENALLERASRERDTNPALVEQAQQILQARRLYGRAGEGFEPDGDWGDATQRAFEAYEPVYTREHDAAGKRQGELEEEETSRRTRASPEVQFLRAVGPFVAPALAYGLGHGTRIMGVRAAQRKAPTLIAQADALLPRNPRPLARGQNAAAATRMGNINAYWDMGGASGRVPFEPTTTARSQRGFRIRPNAASASTLFRESRIARFPDYAIAGSGLVDASISTKFLLDAERERDAARAAVDRDPTNEAKLIRLEDALNQVAIWESAQRAGVGLALGRAGSAFGHRYPSVRPNVGAAEAERVRLHQFLAPKPPRKRKPPPPPPPSPTPQPRRRRRSTP